MLQRCCHILTLPACTSLRAGLQFASDLVGPPSQDEMRETPLTASNISAELEMTVNILIQIDKLVQLLESPVFTCLYPHQYRAKTGYSADMCRPAAATTGTGQIPSSVQMPLWAANAPPTVIRLRRSQEPTEQRQLDRISAHRTKTVCSSEPASGALPARVCSGGRSVSSAPVSSLLLQVPFQYRYSHFSSQLGVDAKCLVLRQAQPAQGPRGGHYTVGRTSGEIPQRAGAC